jgi:hypothetical protein
VPRSPQGSRRVRVRVRFRAHAPASARAMGSARDPGLSGGSDFFREPWVRVILSSGVSGFLPSLDPAVVAGAHVS